MDRRVGATTLGAMLLGGLLYQAKPGNTPVTNQQILAPSPSATKPVTGEGPWKASCEYWSAAQLADSGKSATPSLDVTLHQTGDAVESNIKASTAPEAPCRASGDGWGIPQPPYVSGHLPEISTIVATIPDPIHSHLALDFDRSVDAILLAAADNGYLSSYYWLPWRNKSTSLPAAESASSTTSKDEDTARERQPGLIILRYSPDPTAWNGDKDRFSSSSYQRVIYLFLVGETPALGVNGSELQNAFRYEKTLRDLHQATLSIRPGPFPRIDAKAAEQKARSNGQPSTASNSQAPDASKRLPADGSGCQHDASQGQLSIIGPFFSGSAASLHEGIEAAKRDLCPSSVSISGITGTTVAARQLDPYDEHIYRSFGENTGFEQERFLQSLATTGYDLSRVAVLSEGGTLFGIATVAKKAAIEPEGASQQPNEPKSNKPQSQVDAKSPATSSAHDQPTPDVDVAKKGTVLYLRFPRELSLLRNAETKTSAKSDASAPPTPYLNLTLKDYAADDTVPRFSNTQSPLSIEAQLMAIAHQLQRARAQFILLSASNILDDIFLAQFLHRACPDARLVVFSGGDLLFERDVDNAPYIGSISVSPYLLTSLDFGNKVQWLHPSFQAEEIYNAASYTFWDPTVDDSPKLAGYRRYPVRDPHPDKPQFLQIPLWAAVMGADGYYPLGILHWCASDLEAMLPTIQLNNSAPSYISLCNELHTAHISGASQHVWRYVPESIGRNSGISPSLFWMLIDTLILGLCIVHMVMLWAAQLWSPATRDLAVDQNDQPYRRSVHLNIGTTVLAAMAFVTAYPLILVAHYYHVAFPGHLFAWLTIIAAAGACLSTIMKTWRYRFHKDHLEYFFFNVVAAVALLITTIFWMAISLSGNLHSAHHSYAGLYFCYRCLQPLSGVCPLLPILLMLFAWYCWSICQTARLRFSDIHRPRLPRIAPCDAPQSPPPPYSPDNAPYPLFVPDEALERCGRPIDCCLYDNMTCLLITREVIRRFCTNLKHDSRKAVSAIASRLERDINPVLAGFYLLLFAICVFATHIRSLDRFLFTPTLAPIFSTLTKIFPHFPMHYGPTLYEFLVTAFFFPLLMVALSGWFRTILIWGALRRGLLEPLERFPIRFAFSRFKGVSWMSMLSQSGLHIRWRDMSRTTESIRQLVHHPYVQSDPFLKTPLSHEYEAINSSIRKLMESIRTAGTPNAPACDPKEYQAGTSCLATIWDRPAAPHDADLCRILAIEEGYANFCGILLSSVLVPHWDLNRTGLVEESTPTANEAEAAKAQKTKTPEPQPEPTPFINLAEELVVVRYVALIRAVLVNIRYLMLFVSTAFVLSISAWNAYPFQPHRLVDWCFTFILITIGVGFVWVFAQMHRDPILSRITDTTPNELGWDFYIRIATFGAVPVLTWLAYQFPELGGSLFRIVQPSLQVMK